MNFYTIPVIAFVLAYMLAGPTFLVALIVFSWVWAYVFVIWYLIQKIWIKDGS